jgi:hypothetical protein
LCDVIEIVKYGDNETSPMMPASVEREETKAGNPPFDPLPQKWRTVIVSLLKRKDISPVSKGKEYYFLCRHSALMPLVAGSDYIYHVESGKVKVYAADFPKLGLTDSAISNLKKPAVVSLLQALYPAAIGLVRWVLITDRAEMKQTETCGVGFGHQDFELNTNKGVHSREATQISFLSSGWHTTRFGWLVWCCSMYFRSFKA